VPNVKGSRRGFGSTRKLPSGRYQARYTGPDGQQYSARTEDGRPLTFSTKGDADAYLSLRQSEMVRDAWRPPSTPKPVAAKPITMLEYATAWLADRELETRTREHYQQLLDDHIAPTFGNRAVATIRPPDVRTWFAKLGTKTGPTAKAHSYQLLRTIMHTAVGDELIAANPCRIKGAGSTKRAVKIVPATLSELETLVTGMPGKYQLMTLFAAWCGLRFGELTELRRGDVDVANSVVHVRRGVVKIEGGREVKGPKSEAGKRSVNIPPHLMPAVKAHLKEHAQVGESGLLFPARHGEQIAPSTLYKVYYPARRKAGRPDLRFHDLRHTGAVLAASTGATLAELMARLGHSTPGAALRYQHAAQGRDKAIADALSKLVTGNVTLITEGRRKSG
jgi:integrase